MENILVESEEKFSIDDEKITGIIRALKNELKFSISFLQINFVSSQQIIKINEEYLKHEGSTDIITFNYSDDNFNLEGDCYICVDVAKENAKLYDVSIQNELLRLIIHGVLHLVGYDDIREEDKKLMKHEEDRLLNLFYNAERKLIM